MNGFIKKNLFSVIALILGMAAGWTLLSVNDSVLAEKVGKLEANTVTRVEIDARLTAIEDKLDEIQRDVNQLAENRGLFLSPLEE